MVKLLVQGELLVTMDRQRRVLRDSAVYVEDGKIVEVGDAHTLRSQYRPEKILGGKRKLVMPGFVNCHDHTLITITRQLGGDLDLFEWLTRAIHPVTLAMDVDDAYQSARLCFAEQIRSGITTAMDDSVPWFRNSISKEKLADAIAEAAIELGSRVIEGIGGVDLVDGLGPVGGELFTYEPEKAKRDAINLINRYNKRNGNVRIWTNSSWLPACTGDMYTTMKQVADDYETFTYSHVAEALKEVQVVKQRTGKGPIEYLDSLGFLDKNSLLAHVVWANESDIARLKRTDSKVSHQPVCNQYLGSGIAPIPKMVKEGITVGLGIDDGGHMNEDFFALMKHCALIHRANLLDAAVMTAERVLEMATIGGARALGLDQEIGSLEPGKAADIIIIDFERLNLWPPLRPVIDIVYAGMETDVEATIIKGEVVMEKGKLTKIDEHDLLTSTEKTAWNLIEKSKTWDLINATVLGWRMPQVEALPQEAPIDAS